MKERNKLNKFILHKIPVIPKFKINNIEMKNKIKAIIPF